MFLTNVLLKKVKSKFVKVLLESTGSTHQIVTSRERTAPKVECIRYDPLVELQCVYKEIMKIGKNTSKKPDVNKGVEWKQIYS